MRSTVPRNSLIHSHWDHYTNTKTQTRTYLTRGIHIAGAYLQRELVCWPPNPVLGLHAVLPRQGHSGVVEAPVLFSLQLQDENLQRVTAPGRQRASGQGKVILEY